MITKDKRIDLKASAQDELLLQKAASKMMAETGGKVNVSKVLFHSVKEYVSQEPELFFCNRNAIRQAEQNIEAGREKLQAVIDQCRAIGVSVTIGQVQGWFGTGRGSFMVANEQAIRETVVSLLLEKQLDKYPGLQFTRDNVAVGDLEPLFETAREIIYLPDVNYREVGVYWSSYSISEGRVSVIPEEVEKVKEQFRCYATTTEQREKLARVKTLCRALDAFMKGKDVPYDNIALRGICYYDSETGRYEPSEQYIRFGLTQ
jgi:hypothetical protein